MRMYSNLVERCFTSCCNDFTSKALSSKEVRNDSMRVFLDEVAWFNTLTGAVHDELCRQISKALGESGRAIRGAERRCVNVDYITRTDNNVRRRSYEFCSCTKVVLFGRNSLYFHSPTCAIVFVRVYIAPYCGNSLDVCGTLDNGVVCRSVVFVLQYVSAYCYRSDHVRRTDL